LAAAITLVGAPIALAATAPPENIPPGYNGEENPGGEYTPEGVPPTAPPEGVEQGPPEEVPPEGVPVGPPAETPPAGVPVGSEGTAPPEGVPVGPPAGIESARAQTLTTGQAHALGREQCQEWKTNFRDNRSQFGRCIADVAKALHGQASPREACANMSRKPDENEHRSDFSACVVAAAQALRESND
jgi:hypothetical protein